MVVGCTMGAVIIQKYQFIKIMAVVGGQMWWIGNFLSIWLLLGRSSWESDAGKKRCSYESKTILDDEPMGGRCLN